MNLNNDNNSFDLSSFIPKKQEVRPISILNDNENINNISVIDTNKISSEEINEILNYYKIYVRSNNFCQEGQDQYIRISLHIYNTKKDIDKLINYELKEISACSMFPRTKHIECVCLLERK